MLHILPGIPLGPKPTTSPLKIFKSFVQLSKSRQNLDVILGNKVVQKLKLSKNVNNKKCAPKIIFFNEKKIERFGEFLT